MVLGGASTATATATATVITVPRAAIVMATTVMTIPATSVRAPVNEVAIVATAGAHDGAVAAGNARVAIPHTQDDAPMVEGGMARGSGGKSVAHLMDGVRAGGLTGSVLHELAHALVRVGPADLRLRTARDGPHEAATHERNAQVGKLGVVVDVVDVALELVPGFRLDGDELRAVHGSDEEEQLVPAPVGDAVVVDAGIVRTNPPEVRDETLALNIDKNSTPHVLRRRGEGIYLVGHQATRPRRLAA